MLPKKQARLFERLEKENRSNELRPRSHENLKFWSRIWDLPFTRDNNVQWLKKVETQLRGANKPKSVTITTKNLKKNSYKE